MFEIERESSLELEDKGIKLRGKLSPAQSAEEAEKLALLNEKQEAGASFHCYARRVLHDNGQIYIKRADGSGSSGKAGAALLAALTDAALVNILLTVSASGKGAPPIGLYKKIARELLELSGKRRYSKKVEFVISVPHNRQEMLASLLAKENISLLDRQYSTTVTLKVEAAPEQKPILAELAARCGGEIIQQ